MAGKPIFVATHPRACSTAFERVFMTRRDALTCVHEPFGDAFYYGPERMSERYMDEEEGREVREASGFTQSTYKTIFERLAKDSEQGKRLFIKDITYYLVPPEKQPAQIAPSLGGKVRKGVGTDASAHTNGVTNGEVNGLTNGDHAAPSRPYPFGTEAEPGNPTVVPIEMLKKFHFTFLIRHPRSSIPSYYRCCVPPLDAVTGFYDFLPNEAGYDELRRVFDFLRAQNIVGPSMRGEPVEEDQVSITVVDADDLLDDPHGIIEAYCKEIGLDYTPQMLDWSSETDQKQAVDAFEKWQGFHNDAIDSSSLKPRSHAQPKKTKTEETENKEWTEKFGEKAAKVIRETVNANVKDYEYLKQFAIKLSK